MRRTKWQLSFLVFIISTVFILLVNAATIEKESVKKSSTTTTTSISTHSRKQHHTKHYHHKKDKSVDHARPTTEINNCYLAHHKPKTVKSNTKSHTQTVYVCKTKKYGSTKKHHSSKHGQKNHSKKKTTTTTTKKKHHPSSLSKKKSVSTTIKKSTTTKKSSTKKSVSTKKTHKKTKETSTKKKNIKNIVAPTATITPPIPTTTTTANEIGVTTIVPVIAPYTIPTTETNNSDNATDDNNSSDDSINEPVPTLPTIPTSTNPVEAAANANPAPTHPVDNNNQVNAQTLDNTPDKNSDAQPQSKVIGVSIGAVVGCIAAAGLAGMFIYRRREKNEQDVEELNQTSEVNTRWRTQSFMAVVAGAVAKLPKRSNSTASANGRGSFNVMGSIRRAASNASRSLSVRSNRSNTSSVQSYGIAVSGPIPAIARIDGDQAQYFGEPSSPTATGVHHTHAY